MKRTLIHLLALGAAVVVGVDPLAAQRDQSDTATLRANVERRFEVFPTVIDLTEGVGWLSIGFPERRRPRSPRASCHSCAAPCLQATSR